jgi:GNAT superfamily N-acetyltransferase
MGESMLPAPDEHLTTGWERETPATDTLVRRAVEAHASLPVAVATAIGRPWRSEPGWAGGWVSEAGGMINWVVLRQPVSDATAVMDDVASLFPPQAPYLLVSPWQTPDLRRHGLALLGHPPLMVRFPAEPGPEPHQAVVVREVTGTDELAIAERVLVEGYPLPEMQPVVQGSVFHPAVLDGTTRVWLAWRGDEPVAVAAAHLHAGVTLVEYVAALPQARGLGAGAAVTRAATLADPGRPAVLIASDDGRPVYERLGYVPIERWTAWLHLGTSA